MPDVMSVSPTCRKTAQIIALQPQVPVIKRFSDIKEKLAPREIVSRVLFAAEAAGCHSSGHDVAVGLKRPSPGCLSGPPSNASLFGLAPGGACHAKHVTVFPVRSYRTISRLPAFSGRCIFCGAIPGIAPAGRYPAPCPAEPGLSSESTWNTATATSPPGAKRNYIACLIQEQR